jgi:hypothetical protein
MAWGWMYHQSCRFVEYEKRFILMKDVKGNGFRLNIERFWAGNNQEYAVPWFNFMTRLDALPSNGDVPL